MKRSIGIVHTLQLLHLLKGAGASEEEVVIDEHFITPSGQPIDTLEWLRLRGYRAVAAHFPGVQGGLLFSRKNEPAYVVLVGDTLIWDGEKVTVQ